MQIERVSMQAVQCFHGASAKGMPFRGWAGKVSEWSKKAPPVIAFGRWIPNPKSSYNGGSVVFDCEPFALVMYGSNSKGMRAKDKTTKFGFAGLGPVGQLRVAVLPPNTDAKAIFDVGAWNAPSPDRLVEELIDFEKISFDDLNSKIVSVTNQATVGFGILPIDLSATLDAWPALHPLRNALVAANERLTRQRSEDRAVKVAARIAAAKVEVSNALVALRATGKELSALEIASEILGEDSRVSERKQKAKTLLHLLGKDFWVHWPS